MSFNKLFIQDPPVLAKMISESGPNSYIKSHTKYEMILGHPDSIKMYEITLDGMRLNKTDDQILSDLSTALPAYYNTI
jgi:hypothetical protein